MAQKHFYEVHEPLAAEFRKWFKDASKARNAMLAWCKALGAGCGFAEGSLRVVFYPSFETPPDPKVWKPVKGAPDTYYAPRRGTKDGRILDQQMRDLCTLHPSGDQIAKRIEMQTFGYYDGALRWATPGMRQIGRSRILLSVNSDYKVPKKLEGQLTRLSDLEFEQLTKKSKTRGVRKASRTKAKSKS